MVSAVPAFPGYIPCLLVANGRWRRVQLGELGWLGVAAILAVWATVPPGWVPSGTAAPDVELGFHPEVELTDVLFPERM